MTQFKSSSPISRDSLHLELPEFSLVDLVPGLPAVEPTQGCSFTLIDNDQALRHASSLLRILCATSVPQNQPGQSTLSSNKHLPWLLDSLEALNEEQKRWRDICAYDPVSLLHQALELSSFSSGLDHILSHKVDAMIVLISADVAEQTNEIEDEDQSQNLAGRTLALALVHLANASIGKRPIAKLIAAQLLKSLDRLSADGRVQENSDLKVC